MSSDEMTVWYHPPPGHVVMEADFPARHWVLQLIADFSVLQSYIEVGVERKLNLGAPAAAKVVFRKFLRRLTDEDRWSLVKALAVDCDYDGDLSSGSDTFWQIKRVRDLFAHRSDVPLVREAGSPEFFYFMMGTVPRGYLRRSHQRLCGSWGRTAGGCMLLSSTWCGAVGSRAHRS